MTNYDGIDRLSPGDEVVAALRAMADDSELLWNVARKAIEDELVEWRDSRMFVLRNNGFVISEKDGSPSQIIRFGPETGVRIALLALARHVEESGATS